MDVYGGSDPPPSISPRLQSFTLNADMDWYTARLGTKDWGDKEGKLTIGAVFEDGLVMRMACTTSDHDELRAPR